MANKGFCRVNFVRSSLLLLNVCNSESNVENVLLWRPLIVCFESDHCVHSRDLSVALSVRRRAVEIPRAAGSPGYGGAVVGAGSGPGDIADSPTRRRVPGACRRWFVSFGTSYCRSLPGADVPRGAWMTLARCEVSVLFQPLAML